MTMADLTGSRQRWPVEWQMADTPVAVAVDAEVATTRFLERLRSMVTRPVLQ